MNARGALVAAYLRHRAAQRFSRIMISGIGRISPWELSGEARSPLLAVVNHSSWWDAILPVLVSRGRHYHDGHGLMDRAQLERYTFFRHVGILPIDRDHPRRALASLRELAGTMRGRRSTLWIFPQGKILPNDHRPIEIENGASHLARMLGDCSVVPVAFRYELGREELPLACIRVGEVRRIAETDRTPVRELSRWMASAITANLDALRREMIAEDLSTYAELLRGRRSINRLWDAVRGRG